MITVILVTLWLRHETNMYSPEKAFPGSTTKSNVCLFGSFRERSLDHATTIPALFNHIFDTRQEYPMMHTWCKFGDSSRYLWRVIAWTSRISWISWISKSKWPTWPWKSRSVTPIFNTSQEYPRVIPAQICDEFLRGQWHEKYLVILERVITALDCNFLETMIWINRSIRALNYGLLFLTHA